MSQFLFYVIIGLLVADFIFERFLEYLNSTRWSDQLPEEVKDIYDEEKYRQQQAYEKANFRFSLISSTFSFVIILLMFLLAGFAWVNSMALSVSANPILTALMFFGVLMLASDLINTPFSVYDTFVIEEKFGFNKTTPKTFVLDKLKGYMLGAIIGGGLLALIIYIYQLTTTSFWIYSWFVVSGFSVFMVFFYSNLIVPLFNRQTPLPEGELKSAIENFSASVGFKLDNIYVIDGSKRSTKANAYFTGFGSKKRIILYDTLINDMTTNELVAVLAHEIGHYKKHHVVWSLLLGILQTGIVLFIFSLLVGSKELSAALGVQTPSFHIGLIAFGILYSPIAMITGLAMNIFSRKNEYQADAFAAQNFDAVELASALKKLSVKNLSNLRPHPAYVFFHYSHPTLLQRLEELKSIK
ncbi:MAG: M48 family metallopeptidase [Bacteroidota bacterium]|nr:peptidase M48 [Odoribacter sp.]MDP3645204.1 M48 family metallopeptidase [Bacteroidota bacterium]